MPRFPVCRTAISRPHNQADIREGAQPLAGCVALQEQRQSVQSLPDGPSVGVLLTRRWRGESPANPSLARRFPGNSVKYKELRRFRSNGRLFASKKWLFSATCKEIPWTGEQGIFSGRSGKSDRRNRGDQGNCALHLGCDCPGPFVDPADPVQYPTDHPSYIGVPHRQAGSRRTIMGAQKVIGCRWRSFCANHSRKSNRASTWSS